MSKRKLVIDFFCGAGGAAVGIYRAGYDVIGIDINDQPNYPFKFVKGDAMKLLRIFAENGFIILNDKKYLKSEISWLWASPPCQNYTWSAKRWKSGVHGYAKRKYPDLIKKTRQYLDKIDLPYVIENVPGAPLKKEKMIRLCGAMWNKRFNRHRHFESNVGLDAPAHVPCQGRIARGEAYTIAGHGGNSKNCKLVDWMDAMEINWMTRRKKNLGTHDFPGNREDLCESVPPVYSEFIARQMKIKIRG